MANNSARNSGENEGGKEKGVPHIEEWSRKKYYDFQDVSVLMYNQLKWANRLKGTNQSGQIGPF